MAELVGALYGLVTGLNRGEDVRGSNDGTAVTNDRRGSGDRLSLFSLHSSCYQIMNNPDSLRKCDETATREGC
jgi:hypothetical protein